MHDPVNHPAHYSTGRIEVIDFIEDKELGFGLGNVIKYVARAGKKDSSKSVEDLEKAAWYLRREIERLKKNERSSMDEGRNSLSCAGMGGRGT